MSVRGVNRDSEPCVNKKSERSQKGGENPHNGGELVEDTCGVRDGGLRRSALSRGAQGHRRS